MKKTLITLLFGILVCTMLPAQGEWLVPDEYKTRLADFEFTTQSVEFGQNIYLANCRSCHGMPGEGNYINLNPSPGDPASDKIQHNTDGELYYKLREGRGQMPSFKKVLTMEQIWEVVAYLRSFNPDYVQQVAVAAANNRWTNILIHLTLMSADKKIRAEVSGMEGTVRTPVAGAEVRLEAARRFGNLQLGEALMTNEEGFVFFNMPEDLPGDPEGKLTLIAQLDDEEEFGLVKTDTLLQAGLAYTPVSLTAERAMWNTMRKAPVWLLLTYGLGVLAVWGFIFLVMMQLRTIFKLGEKNETNPPDHE